MTWYVLVVLLCQSVNGYAQDPGLQENEKRISDLSQQLRCLVCQNQSLDESEASLAVDLKNQVKSMVLEGASDKEIRDYMVDRYGDFILYSPPINWKTSFLWFGPFGFLLGIIVLFRKSLLSREKVFQSKRYSEEDFDEARRRLRD